MDDDYGCDDLDILTALLDEEDDAQDTTPQQFNYTNRPSSQSSTSQTNSQTPKSSESDSQDGNVLDKSKDDLVEELRLMKEKMKQLEAQVKSKETADLATSQEIFSDAINPSIENTTKRERSATNTQKGKTSTKAKADQLLDDLDHQNSSSTSKTQKEGSSVENLFGKNKNRIAHTQYPSQKMAKGTAYNEQKSLSKNLGESNPSIKEPVKNGHLSTKSNQFSAHTSAIQRRDPKHKAEDAMKCETEVYSQIRLINPLISSEMMKVRMEGRKMVRMSVLRKHISSGRLDGDWVTVGVVVNKIPPKTSANGKQYSIWKLNDLQNVDTVTSLFLFGDVHKEHWKTSVGTVIGLLNAEVMSQKDGADETALKVDHPQKIMIIGTSKDLGLCKGRRKDGKGCSMFVNKAECEFCQYHVQSAYKKMSAKRSDLQSSYTGSQPKAFRQQLKTQNIFYGGQSFSSQKPSPSTSKGAKNSKVNNSLKSLNLSKAKELQESDNINIMKINSLSTEEAADFLSVANGNEEFQNRLVTPTLGSRNLLHHMKKVEEEEKVKKGLVQTITASELLKMQKQKLSEQQNARKRKLSATASQGSSVASQASGPMLGRGLKKDRDFFIDFSPPSAKTKNSAVSSTIAKKKAAAILKAQGPLRKENPNAIEKSRTPTSKTQEAIRRRVESSIGKLFEEDKPEEQPKKKRKFLGADLAEIDTNSEEFLKVMQAKSRHSDMLHEVESDLQEKYFNELEKKEKLETKMASVVEKECRVVSCHQCKYTYFGPAARCKKENHSLKWHDAKQRFFVCKDCNTRMFTFNKIPNTSCRNCGGAKFNRTGMLTERKGPKIGGETLLLRGEEQKWASS